MRLRSLDMNMLVTLNALLEERSVTGAARKIDVAQPTMSTAIARLRRHFGDELLVRAGNHYELTQLALQLRPQAADLVAGAERLFAIESTFDPAASTREFTVMSSDYGLWILGAPLANALAAGAPGCRLRLVPLTMEALVAHDDALHDNDLMLLPKGIVDAPRHLDVLSDEWVGVVAAGNTLVGESLTLGDLAALPWVVTAGGTSGPTGSIESTPAVRQLELLGIRPRIAVVTESFLGAPMLVSGSDRVAIVQRSVAEYATCDQTLRIVGLPFSAPPLVEAVWWHPARERDAAHRWLREVLGWIAADFAGRRNSPWPLKIATAPTSPSS